MTSTIGTFDLHQPVPSGRLVIEASAGTGKTHTIAGLVAKYVVGSAITMDQLLVVTFTRLAARELSVRIRESLQQSLSYLLGQNPGESLSYLGLFDEHSRNQGVARIRRALQEIDGAAITTIHGFAQNVLVSLGSSHVDVDARFSTDDRALIYESSIDAIASHAIDRAFEGVEFPSPETVVRLVNQILNNPGILIETTRNPKGPASKDILLRRILDRALSNVSSRRATGGTLAFSEQLTALRNIVHERSSVRQLLERRYRVVLIDEFQDTDPVQWEIFEELFGSSPGGALIMVGDPKQAIYSFRGANVHTYLRAASREIGTQRMTLGTNWRSDGALLLALESLFEGVTFGSPHIPFRAVKAGAGLKESRLRDETTGRYLPAFVLRLVQEDVDIHKPIATAAAAKEVTGDVASQVSALLRCDVLVNDERRGEVRRVQASDIAVLVNTRAQIVEVQEALLERSIPSIKIGGDSVLRSEAADHWRHLLLALADPSNAATAKTAALTWFFETDLPTLSGNDATAFSAVHEQLLRWSQALESNGVSGLWRSILEDSGVRGRVLGWPQGERHLTDVEHIASLLQTRFALTTPTPLALLDALDSPERLAVDVETEDSLTSRTDSEAAGVQVMTIHAAKGLEFPFVLVPFGWRAGHSLSRQLPHIFEDPVQGRTIDVSRSSATRGLAIDEVVGEQFRLLYVALTRAKHQVILWWANATGTDAMALSRVLFDRDAEGRVIGTTSGDRLLLPGSDERLDRVVQIFGEKAKGDDAIVEISIVEASDDVNYLRIVAPAGGPLLEVATFDRALERRRSRWSFTAIAAHRRIGFDPGDDMLGDARAQDEGGSLWEPAGQDFDPALNFGSERGTEFGDFVHAMLRRIDFSEEDLDRVIDVALDEVGMLRGRATDGHILHEGLRSVIETPLGGFFGDFRLRNLRRRDRLDELSFELLLERPDRAPTPRDIGSLLLEELSRDDPLWPWAHALAGDPRRERLTGHLTGSIDLVLRTNASSQAATNRYYLCDYKTNMLGDKDHVATLANFAPDHLAIAMQEHDYPLQALLYAVALHRYLRWRVPHYDPGLHFGGVAYLFLRAMLGEGSRRKDGTTFGVFLWKLSPRLIGRLSELLSGTGLSR